MLDVIVFELMCENEVKKVQAIDDDCADHDEKTFSCKTQPFVVKLLMFVALSGAKEGVGRTERGSKATIVTNLPVINSKKTASLDI